MVVAVDLLLPSPFHPWCARLMPPRHHQILFWSKDSEQEAVVNVQLEMPYFAPVTFAFNKVGPTRSLPIVVATAGRC